MRIEDKSFPGQVLSLQIPTSYSASSYIYLSRHSHWRRAQMPIENVHPQIRDCLSNTTSPSSDLIFFHRPIGYVNSRLCNSIHIHQRRALTISRLYPFSHACHIHRLSTKDNHP